MLAEAERGAFGLHSHAERGNEMNLFSLENVLEVAGGNRFEVS